MEFNDNDIHNVCMMMNVRYSKVILLSIFIHCFGFSVYKMDILLYDPITLSWMAWCKVLCFTISWWKDELWVSIEKNKTIQSGH